ncbi:hypothetical protein [Pseudolactococcus raffinolactis]|uniref:hypothetical protein n=1 Tax=Pseudolactococcus raffinolactis TaxID=1366 RepID=UPI001436BCDC|nr:hypothetical protein [Lactococcus raffinolactis]QIW51163.1 hypothetical protein GU337_04380 [Lactococcus raffinolactis]
MAKKRMFSADIVRSDLFLDLPISSQLLYFHFGMIADDDGIVASIKRELSYLGFGSLDDLKCLHDKNLVEFTDDGKILFIIDWRKNNSIRNDIYKPTFYLEARENLENKGFSFKGSKSVPSTLHERNGDVSLDKIRLDKDRLDLDIDKELVSGINQPTLDQIESISESEALRNIELNKKFKVYSDTYPKKTKKIEAREFFNRLSDDEIEKVIIGAQNVLKLSKTMSSEEYKYLKNQATFISDSEYLDYQASRNDKPQTPVGSRVPEWAKEEKKKVVREW